MYELVGYRRVDMIAEKKSDSDTHGFSCWFLMDELDQDFHGRSGVKVFFSDDKFPEFPVLMADKAIKLGDRFLLVFNQKGKLQGFNKLDG